MIRAAAWLCLASLAAPSFAQTFPTPGVETPRVQTVEWQAGEAIVLTALPDTTLTVMLEPGEQIIRAALAGSNAWDIAVSAESDSLQVTPQGRALPAELTVETGLRSYAFVLETGQGLMAAYLVRVEQAQSEQPSDNGLVTSIEDYLWSYRVRGDREVRPAAIRDNGAKTVIEYAPGQPLPAVFALGPTGEEEVVNGYMRDGLFVIDRVYEELIFRIDKDKATARRREREESEK